MKSLLPHRLDKLEREFKPVDELVKNNFPTHLFENASLLTEKEINYVIKLIIKKLQLWVSKSEYWDIKKYVYNYYSKDDYLNYDFYDLVSSVFDYLEQKTKQVINSGIIKNEALLIKAIDATFGACTVFIVSNNPLINKVLTDSQKDQIKNITNNTATEVTMLESNRRASNKGNKMNKMAKVLLAKQMSSGDGDINPAMMMMMMDNDKGSEMDPMMVYAMMNSKGESKDNSMDSMLVYAMMNSKGESKDKSKQSTEKKSGINPAMMMAILNSKKESASNEIDPMMMFAMMNSSGEKADSNDAILKAYLMQESGYGMGMDSDALKMMALSKAMGGNGSSNMSGMFSCMGHGYGSLLSNPAPGAYNPAVAHLYDDPELSGPRTGRDFYAEAIQRQWEKDKKDDLRKRAQEKMDEMLDELKSEDPEKYEQLKAETGYVDHDTGFVDDNPDLPRYPDPDEDNSQLASRHDKGIAYELYDSDKDTEVDVQINSYNTRKDPKDPYANSYIPPFFDEDFGEPAYSLEIDEPDGTEAVIFDEDYEEEHKDIFQMLQEDFNQYEAEKGEPELSEKEKRSKEIAIKNQMEDQQLMLDKFFDGKVPEGVGTIEIEGLPHYLFTPEALFSGKYNLSHTINYYLEQGRVPPADLLALPLTVKGKTMVHSILNSDGVRIDIVTPDKREEGMKIEDHIPAKAMVRWKKLQERFHYMNDGTILDDSVVVMSNELTGTTNSASIVANCYAIASESIDLVNSEHKPIEYTVNDPVGFYVEDAQSVIDKFNDNIEIYDIKSFVKSVNEDDALDIGIKSYIDKKGTEVINDFLKYSMVLNVEFDSFLNEYEELEEYIKTHHGESFLEYLNKAQVKLTKAICSAVKGDCIEDLASVSVELKVKEMENDKEVTKTKKVDGEKFNSNLVVFNNRTQITELPWMLEDLGLDFVKQIPLADPFIMLTKENDYGTSDIYESIEELALRATLDGNYKNVTMITKDRVKISIVQSAYDDETFMIVKRKD